MVMREESAVTGRRGGSTEKVDSLASVREMKNAWGMKGGSGWISG